MRECSGKRKDPLRGDVLTAETTDGLLVEFDKDFCNCQGCGTQEPPWIEDKKQEDVDACQFGREARAPQRTGGEGGALRASRRHAHIDASMPKQARSSIGVGLLDRSHIERPGADNWPAASPVVPVKAWNILLAT